MSASFNADLSGLISEASVEDAIAIAKSSENAERYEDMCAFMKKVVESSTDPLNQEHRNLLSVAYKNVIGARRAAWRTLSVDENKDKPAISSYSKILEREMEAVCNEILKLLQDHLINKTDSSSDPEQQVFYYKMAGDYYRYLAEFKTDDTSAPTHATENYQKASDIAEANLPPTHPIRLGLALNFSVCYYEINKEPQKACELAKRAFDDAIAKLDQLDEASYKDSTLIMQLLRDNLTLWASDQNNEED